MTESATRHPSRSIDDDFDRRFEFMAAQIAFLVDRAEVEQRRHQPIDELIADVSPILQRVTELAIERAADWEAKGYRDFAEASIGVVDRVATTYTKEDVEALADNIIRILDIIRDLTQPEMLAIAQRMLDTVTPAAADTRTPAEPPGLFSLVRRLRDPDVRRGLGRALDTFKAVNASRLGEDTPHHKPPEEVPDAIDHDR